MELLINRKPSKSGKGAVYFPTINGLRINATNYKRKWEAKSILKRTIAHYGEATLLKMIGAK